MMDDKVASLALLLLWLFAYLWFFLGTVRGNLAEKSYSARMNPLWGWLLMPGKLKDKQTWVHQQRILYWATFPLALVVWLMLLLSILGGHKDLQLMTAHRVE